MLFDCYNTVIVSKWILLLLLVDIHTKWGMPPQQPAQADSSSNLANFNKRRFWRNRFARPILSNRI